MGRQKKHKKSGGARSQSPKKSTGHGRGHGIHHRLVGRKSGAPRPIASGRKRAAGDGRDHSWRKLDDALIDDMAGVQKTAAVARRLTTLKEAERHGTELQGPRARGVIVTVRRGSFLTELLEAPQLPEKSPPLPPLLRVRPRGVLKQFDVGQSSPVAAGDEVDLVVPPVEGNEPYEGYLTAVRPRGSEFRRLHPSGRALQTIAANISRVAVVASADAPPFRPGFVDRVWVCALTSNLPLFLILNKTDLGVCEKDEQLLKVYERLGLPVVRTSALTGEGLDELTACFSGERRLPTPAGIPRETPPPETASAQTAAVPPTRTVLCGHSGVGKSSLIAALNKETGEKLRIGELAAKTKKGAHTTTHARLYHFPDPRPGPAPRLSVIDTPGVREFTPADTDRGNLWGWFPEIRVLQGKCRFADCSHTVEAGCAILAAVEAGEIHPRRHESYVRIYKTLPA